MRFEKGEHQYIFLVFLVPENLKAVSKIENFSVEYPYTAWKLSNKISIDEIQLIILEEVMSDCGEKSMLVAVLGLSDVSGFIWNDQNLTFLC